MRVRSLAIPALRTPPCLLARRLLLDARAGDVVLCAANMKTKGAHGMDGTAVVTGGAGGIGKRLAIYHNDHGWTLNPASEK